MLSSLIASFSGQPFENLKALSKVEGLSANTKSNRITKARKLEGTKKGLIVFLSCFHPFVFSW
jgi:hypothetical protein